MVFLSLGKRRKLSAGIKSILPSSTNKYVTLGSFASMFATITLFADLVLPSLPPSLPPSQKIIRPEFSASYETNLSMNLFSP
jgi:hypothetical protein